MFGRYTWISAGRWLVWLSYVFYLSHLMVVMGHCLKIDADVSSLTAPSSVFEPFLQVDPCYKTYAVGTATYPTAGATLHEEGCKLLFVQSMRCIWFTSGTDVVARAALWTWICLHSFLSSWISVFLCFFLLFSFIQQNEVTTTVF